MFYEETYAKSGVELSIIDISLGCDNFNQSISFLGSVGDIRMRESVELLLKLSFALGVAKAMGNEYLYHSGDFGWLAGLHKKSYYTQEKDFQFYEGYSAEYDIPLSMIDDIPDAIESREIDKSVKDFFEKFNIDFK